MNLIELIRGLNKIAPAVLAGGAVRDWHYNVHTPKDYDIVLLKQIDPYYVQAMLQLAKLPSDFFEHYESAEDKFSWVVKTKAQYCAQWVDVDIIQYSEDVSTPQKLVQTFDWSLNGIAMEFHDTPQGAQHTENQHFWYTKHFANDFPMEYKAGAVAAFRGKFDPGDVRLVTRKAYLQGKYPLFTFEE